MPERFVLAFEGAQIATGGQASHRDVTTGGPAFKQGRWTPCAPAWLHHAGGGGR